MTATLVIYQPVKDNDFINFDDDMYVTDNSRVQSGLSWHNVGWAFKSFEASNYHPVTWLSHMLDCQLYGLNSTGHHFMSLSFHLINVALLFLVFQSMTGAVWRSAFVAALFALHPINVESVAWIAERKNVLSTMFWLLTMWSYVSLCGGAVRLAISLSFSFFTLGLLTKPMLVTLPFVLLLLDYWPLNRFRQATDPLSFDIGTEANQDIFSLGEKQPSKSFTNTLLWLVIEKIPLFVLSIGSSIITVIVQKNSGALKSTDNVDVKTRILNTAVSYVDYIYLMVWPTKLSVFYPHPDSGIPYKNYSRLCAPNDYLIHCCSAGEKTPLHLGWLAVVYRNPGAGDRSGSSWRSGDGRSLRICTAAWLIHYHLMGRFTIYFIKEVLLNTVSHHWSLRLINSVIFDSSSSRSLGYQPLTV
ncbi:MAG: hypothetical protein WKF84_13570 [Pyrinomonadaceae bacterium]